MIFDIRDILTEASRVVSAHAGEGPGEYHRVLKAQEDKSIKTGITAYGCTDAACILYTLGELPEDPAQREGFVKAIRRFQNPHTGLFEDGSHHEIHTTAFALAALDFFDARAEYAIKALHPLRERAELEAFLDNLRWEEEPWLDSHKGAGIYSALVLNGEVSREWEDWYFDWLWEQEDPETGFWRKGNPLPLDNPEAPVPLFHYLGGSFHYLFNIVYAKRKQRYPERAIDTCLEIWKKNHQPLYGEPFCGGVSYAEIDWVFYLNRSLRQCGYRFEESRKAMEQAAEKYIDYLKRLDYRSDASFNDLHKLFGMVCALSEFQLVLPDQLITKRPLRQVLDRRPYI
ncbi:MAG: hypothetical protein ACYS8Z_06780 [Planctomycetota bacterium]|jgi:hypothetical protein